MSFYKAVELTVTITSLILLFCLVVVFFFFKPVEVTKAEFIEHYTKQRASFYPTDEYFITSVGGCWGV